MALLNEMNGGRSNKEEGAARRKERRGERKNEKVVNKAQRPRMRHGAKKRKKESLILTDRPTDGHTLSKR